MALVRGARAAARLQAAWPRLVLVHTPVHASWLNQVEIYFSIVQRKVLTSNDFSSLAAVKGRSPPSRIASFSFKYAMPKRPSPFSGPSRAATSLGCSPNSRAGHSVQRREHTSP